MYALSDFGSYTVGGRNVTVEGEPQREIWFTATTSYPYDPNGQYAIEHAYVQYFVPSARNRHPPIILLHGGGMSGATWETTPDGRPGWLQLLLNHGFEVHVVDGVERGRAGWCALDGVWPDAPVQRTMEEAWTLFRFGHADGFGARRGFAGQRFPVASLEALARGFVPRWTSTTAAAIAAFGAVLARVGTAIVMCHSQGGQIAFEAGARQPESVAAMVAIEPSGFSEVLQSWVDKDVLMVYGDYQDVGGNVPNLLAKGEAWARALRDAGGGCDIVHLPSVGVAGNSHFLMMDDNNGEVLDRVVAWIDGR